MEFSEVEEISYGIDSQNSVYYTSSSWDQSAIDGKTPQVIEEKILGEPLFNYISDLSTRHIYQLLVDKVRKSSQPISFPFRCDTLHKIRHMNMIIEPEKDGKVIFRSQVIRSENIDYQPLLDPDQKRGQEFITMCSWCKKIEVESGKWLELEEALDVLKLGEYEKLPKITHGICQPCYKFYFELEV